MNLDEDKVLVELDELEDFKVEVVAVRVDLSPDDEDKVLIELDELEDFEVEAVAVRVDLDPDDEDKVLVVLDEPEDFEVEVGVNLDELVVGPDEPEDFGGGMGALTPDAATPRIRHSETYPLETYLQTQPKRCNCLKQPN